MEYKDVDGERQYKVLLADKSWTECDEYGNFETALVEHYQIKYTQQNDNEDGFKFTWDGFDVSSKATLDKKATTVITRPGGTPVIDTGVGVTYEEDGNTTTFTATEPYAPVYFKSRDGIKTEMYYFGGTQKTFITVPASAVDNDFEKTVPMLKFTSIDAEGGSSNVTLDWFKNLSYDNQISEFEPCDGVNVTARYHGGSSKEVYYTIEIISDKGENEAVEITYSDGYTGKFYCSTAASGNGVGVIELSSVYKTTRYSTSDLVEVITTDENGLATSKELPLGKYIVRELTAPDGYVTNSEGREVELKYKDQFTPLVWETKTIKNEAVSVEIELEKVFETAYESGVFNPSDGAKFGIYTNEKISAAADNAGLSKSAEKGTLIDIFEVDSEGKALRKIKLPQGTYYIKELATKAGYVLNDTPFYFEVAESETLKSSPVTFKSDTDGISGDVVMDSYGTAVIRFDTLTRLPMPNFTMGGKIYSLSESYTDENVKVTSEKDRARAEITVTDGESADIILPNGKQLKVTVSGNSYSYSYDGVSDTFVPSISHTGYRADFVKEFTSAVKPDFSAETDEIMFKAAGDARIKASVTHTPVTYEEVVTPGVDIDGDGKYDKEGEKAPVTETKGKLDEKGNQIYTHKAAFRLENAAGNNIADSVLIRNGKEEAADVPVQMEAGDVISVNTADKTQFTVRLTAAGDMRISAGSYIKRSISEVDKPAATVNGTSADDKIKLYKNVTLARSDYKARTIQIKVNAEEIDIKGIENNKDKPEIPDTPDTPVTPVTPEKPSIKTSARDLKTGINVSKADSNVTIIDTVSYTNLIVGKEYLLKGILMDKASQKPIKDATGKEVTAEKKFVPSASSGTVDIKFVLDGSDLGNRVVVVFERLYSDNKEVAVHTDINDKEQSVYFPKLHTTAIDGKTKGHIALAAKNMTITDVVSYYNLPQGKYTVKGVLMDKGTGKTVKEAGKEIIVEKTFIVEDGKPNGTLEMEFSFDGSNFAGRTIVVFERLYRDDKEVADHTDISDKNQSIYIPKVKTTAAYSHTGEIADIVSYSNLIRGKTYKVMGVLVDSKTGKPVKSADGKEITAVKKFVAEKEAGTVSVVFHFAEKDLAGKTVVVFETLMLEDEIIAEHKDINDKKQTVKIKEPIDGVPKTGDETGLMQYLILFVISAIGFVIAGYMMSRKKRIKN